MLNFFATYPSRKAEKIANPKQRYFSIGSEKIITPIANGNLEKLNIFGNEIILFFIILSLIQQANDQKSDLLKFLNWF